MGVTWRSFKIIDVSEYRAIVDKIELLQEVQIADDFSQNVALLSFNPNSTLEKHKC